MAQMALMATYCQIWRPGANRRPAGCGTTHCPGMGPNDAARGATFPGPSSCLQFLIHSDSACLILSNFIKFYQIYKKICPEKCVGAAEDNKDEGKITQSLIDSSWLFLVVLGCSWLFLVVLGCSWLFLVVLLLCRVLKANMEKWIRMEGTAICTCCFTMFYRCFSVELVEGSTVHAHRL